jgi:hypothetical protein
VPRRGDKALRSWTRLTTRSPNLPASHSGRAMPATPVVLPQPQRQHLGWRSASAVEPMAATAVCDKGLFTSEGLMAAIAVTNP